MKSSTFLFIALFSMAIPALAKITLVMAPLADEAAYQRNLESSAGFQSYIATETEKIQTSEKLDSSLLSAADNLEKPLPLLLAQLRQLHESAPWSVINTHFLADLFTKINETPLGLEEKKTAEDFLCQAQYFANRPLSSFCRLENADMKSLRHHFPGFEILLIESKAVNLNEDLFLNIPLRGSFHWTFLSNKNKAWHFYGTYNQLLQQTALPEPLVHGSCENYSTAVDDFELESAGFIYFDDHCLKALHQEPPETGFVPWLKENKSWLIPVGIVVTGLIAYQMRNNLIIIDSPFSK